MIKYNGLIIVFAALRIVDALFHIANMPFFTTRHVPLIVSQSVIRKLISAVAWRVCCSLLVALTTDRMPHLLTILFCGDSDIPASVVIMSDPYIRDRVHRLLCIIYYLRIGNSEKLRVGKKNHLRY